MHFKQTPKIVSTVVRSRIKSGREFQTVGQYHPTIQLALR